MPSTLISQDTFEYEQNGWNDRLTKFNNDKISYDLNGNPLKYRDGMSFTWVNGRRLKTILYNGNTYAMSYDTNGMRTQKGNTHYYYDSSNNLVGMTKNNKTLFFYYDESGAPTSFSYNGLMHYYIKNLQGDIVKIVNSQGQTVASYAYDVSGKILSIKDYHSAVVTDPLHIGMLNPLRYRGYVYDDETGLYYLQSRYYDPVTTRFINADVYCDTQTHSPLSVNMFAYCENNAVNMFDKSGKDAWWIRASASAGTMGHISLLLEEKPNYWWYFYYGGKSIQMFFLGSASKIRLNEYVNNMVGAFNFKYRLNIQNKDVYTDGLSLKGNFNPSVNEILYFIRMEEMHTKSKIYRLKFNAGILSDDYKKINSNNINRILNYSTHLYYLQSTRPQSFIVIEENTNYNILSHNCMNQSAYFLCYGKLYNSKHNLEFQEVMDRCYDAFGLVPNGFFMGLKSNAWTKYFKIKHWRHNYGKY